MKELMELANYRQLGEQNLANWVNEVKNNNKFVYVYHLFSVLFFTIKRLGV